jgi:putative selenium metabolism protein SsnA
MLLIGNGRLITRDEAAPYLENGAVACDGETIAAVGVTSALRAQYPDAEFLDARGGVIMPGLINTHEHIYSSFARGLTLAGYSPGSFTDILEGMWWRIDRCLTNRDTRWSACASYLDCIRNGVTTVFDHHASYGEIEGSLATISETAREMGVRTCLCYEVSDRDGEDKMKAAVAENEAFIRTAWNDPMQKGMTGLHAAFTLSDGTLQYCREHTPVGAGFHIHVAEGVADLQYSLKNYGQPVVERLWQQGILGSATVAAHCIHVNAREMDILKDTDTMVVHNPESNMGTPWAANPCSSCTGGVSCWDWAPTGIPTTCWNPIRLGT